MNPIFQVFIVIGGWILIVFIFWSMFYVGGKADEKQNKILDKEIK